MCNPGVSRPACRAFRPPFAPFPALRCPFRARFPLPGPALDTDTPFTTCGGPVSEQAAQAPADARAKRILLNAMEKPQRVKPCTCRRTPSSRRFSSHSTSSGVRPSLMTGSKYLIFPSASPNADSRLRTTSGPQGGPVECVQSCCRACDPRSTSGGRRRHSCVTDDIHSCGGLRSDSSAS